VHSGDLFLAIPMANKQPQFIGHNMASSYETRVLAVLGESEFLTIEQLVEQVPELTWNQLFHILDDLSRRNAIVLRRRGFEYEVKTRSPIVASQG